jgi:group I intron endonuclease
MNKSTGECIYIGSSFEIMKRVYSHVYNSLHSCQKPLYQYIIDNGGWDIFEFVIFQEYTNVNKEFLLSKEREYIELYKPHYNFNRPIVSEKERNYRENTEERKQQKKEYYEKNSDRFKEKYREDVKLKAIRPEYPNILECIKTLEGTPINFS